jgi:hypothetical protein
MPWPRARWSAQPRSFAARARPRAGRTCAAPTDARPTTRRAAHQNSRECSGHVPTRSLSWAARTSVANSVHRMQHSTKPQTRTPRARWRRAVVATGCDRCNMQHGLFGGSANLKSIQSTACECSEYPLRTRACARPSGNACTRVRTRGGAVSGVGPAPSAGFRLGLPRAARTRSCGHTPVSTRSTPM